MEPTQTHSQLSTVLRDVQLEEKGLERGLLRREMVGVANVSISIVTAHTILLGVKSQDIISRL